MRSPQERALWTGVLVVLLAGAAAAWWTAERWTPHAGPWVKHAWRSVTRPPSPQPGDRTAHRSADAAKASAEAPPPRKCVQGTRTTYTDQPCPPGSDEPWIKPPY